ncbi:MAG: hypothetical protein AAF282_01125 [Cyanobacteria bacterium P01_A01_bin.15]
MKQSINLAGLWNISLWVTSLLGISLSVALPVRAQTVLRIDPDTSSFENVELTDGDVGVRISYTHYQELAESDDNNPGYNLSYQLVYQGEPQETIDNLTWLFAEFELWDLDSNGTEEIVVRNFSGGAHCCTNTTIYSWTATGFTATETGHIDGMGAILEDLDGDGAAEVLIPDQAFLYRFGSYVESFPPMTISAYQGGELVDITHQFPDRIRDQAETARETFLAVQADHGLTSNSMLASYVAQQALLDEDFEAAWQFMLDSYNPDSTWGLEIHEDGEKVGYHSDFPAALRAFLIETGYLNRDGQPIGQSET